MIYKDPVTDTGKFKKSAKGLQAVVRAGDGSLKLEDGLDMESYHKTGNHLRTIFKNGRMVVESLDTVRNRLHNNNF